MYKKYLLHQSDGVGREFDTLRELNRFMIDDGMIAKPLKKSELGKFNQSGNEVYNIYIRA